jgi:hypothetical protein
MSKQQPIIEALNDNLRVIYRKAVDADAALNKLQSKGKGKFNTIFAEDAGFTANSKRFGPYVEELAGDVAGLVDANEQQLSQALPVLVKKIETMLTTLEQFKHIVK